MDRIIPYIVVGCVTFLGGVVAGIAWSIPKRRV